MIESEDYLGRNCRLVDAQNRPVIAGSVLADQWGESWAVTGGRAPHNASAGGHVYVDHVEEGFHRNFYTSVLGLHWEAV